MGKLKGKRLKHVIQMVMQSHACNSIIVSKLASSPGLVRINVCRPYYVLYILNSTESICFFSALSLPELFELSSSRRYIIHSFMKKNM